MLNSVAMGWPIRWAWSLLLVSQFFPVWYSSYALLVLVLVLTFHGGQLQWKSAFTNRWWQLWAVYFGWQLTSMSWTTNLTDGWSNLSTQLLLLLLPLLLLLRPPNPKDVFWLFKTHLLASLGAMLYALLSAYLRIQSLNATDFGTISRQFSYTGLSEPIMHPGYFSLNLVLSLGLCFLLIQHKVWRWHLATISYILFTALFLVMLNGRMTLIAAFLTLSVGLILYAFRSKQIKPLLVLLVLAIGLFGTIPFLPPAVKGRLMEVKDGFSYDMANFQKAEYNGVSIRLALWKCAGELIVDHGIWGVGAGDGKDELRKIYTKYDLQFALDDQLNSHNQFLENMVYGGLVQGALLLLIFIWGWSRSYLYRNWPWAAFLFFVFLCLQTETILFWHRGALFFGIFSSLLYLNPPVSKSKDLQEA